MKLKKSQDAEMTSVADAAPSVLADRFKLDLPAAEPVKKSSGGIGTTIAAVCAIAAAALLGVTFWLIYQNLELIENV